MTRPITVRDVISALEKLPPSLPVVVHDADTDALFDVIHIGPDSEHAWEKGSPGTISIWVDYHEEK